MFDLKRFRQEKKVKQKDIQDILGCSQPFLSQIESGKRSMPNDFLQILSEKFGNISNYITEDIAKYNKPENDNCYIENIQIKSLEQRLIALESLLHSEREKVRLLENSIIDKNKMIEMLQNQLNSFIKLQEGSSTESKPVKQTK